MNRNHHPPLPPEVQAHLAPGPAAAQRRVERVWQLLGSADAPPVVPTDDEAWIALQQRLALADAAPPAVPDRRLASDRQPAAPRTWPRWAAAVALGAVVVLLALWGWTWTVTIAVPPGAHLTVDLPDGSRAELNSGSRLQYRRGFAVLPGGRADQRLVRLEGEAFFDVVGGERPFVVATANARVEVLGTRFNVRAWPEAGAASTQVTLAEGQVRLVGAGGAASVVLAAAGAVAQVRGAAAPEAVAAPDATLEQTLAWRQDGFVMIRQPTPAVLAELERVFGVSIEVDPALALADTTTLIHLRETEASRVVHDFCLAQGCQYRRTSHGFALVPARPGTFPLHRR